MPVAVVTGAFGQDGTYLCNLLLSKGYKVFGLANNCIPRNELHEASILDPNFSILKCDIGNYDDVLNLIKKTSPDEVYNFAAYSFVADSDNNSFLLHKITASAPINFAEAIRCVDKSIKLFQASSSEVFGGSNVSPQRENTLQVPRNSYGIAKSYAHKMLEQYREHHGLFIVIGILYNHESPLRDKKFVTRKITSIIADIARGKPVTLELGNLDAVRDWGYAKEYVMGFWRSMQLEKSETFVFSTGVQSTVRDFVSSSFLSIGIKVFWKGSGTDEVGFDEKGNILVTVNDVFYRENEKVPLIGDASKASDLIGWKANFELSRLCDLMVQYDLNKELGLINE
ncbi:GDP-mannose 4,6-dehydratase [Vibrio sp. 10N.222.52.B7]|uniref:GDP-mannose 4,6-dehydratase n=1 Tax=Vibrio sp. 10N.222.52.B7 TaxID=3229629 RepID=UPI00354FF73D